MLEESPESGQGRGFVIGDGGHLPNNGPKRLRFETTCNLKNLITLVFQIAGVARPLMSVGKVCDQNSEVAFDKVMAIVRQEVSREEICRFHREHGGLDVAKLLLKRPKPPFTGPA